MPWHLFSAQSLEKELFPTLTSLTKWQECTSWATQLTAGESSSALKASVADIRIKYNSPISSLGSSHATQFCSHKKQLLPGSWQTSQSSRVEWQGGGKDTVPGLVMIFFSLSLDITSYRGDVLTSTNHLHGKLLIECMKSHFEDKPNCTTSVTDFLGALAKYFPTLFRTHVCPLWDLFNKT